MNSPLASATLRPQSAALSRSAWVLGTSTFQLLAHVALRGGFSGTESVLADRRVGDHVTVLTGDIGTQDDPSDNSYHVVTGATNATLDGFTVSGGLANGTSPTATRMGGGLYNWHAAPTVSNCIFTNNSADYLGGAIANSEGSSPTVTNCVFTNNKALSGGGMGNRNNSSPTITNCTFASNSGGAIFDACFGMYCDQASEPKIANCILWGDTAGTSGSEITDPVIVPENGGSLDPLSPDYYARAKVRDSIVQGGFQSGINISTADPLLVDAANGDLHLSAGSPAIDAGDGCASQVTLVDRDGNRRWDLASTAGEAQGLDIGAFEYQGTAGIDAPVAAFSCD